MSKYLGETLGKSENPDIVIIRTSWLYGGNVNDRNFVNTMLTLSEKRSELRIVDDQFGSPTYTGDLARALSSVIAHFDHYQ